MTDVGFSHWIYVVYSKCEIFSHFLVNARKTFSATLTEKIFLLFSTSSSVKLYTFGCRVL
jgi:hypothetical protein